MKLAKSTKRVEELMRVLPSAMNAKSLEALRLVKQELVEIDARAGALRELLLESLDDEEDVQGLLISRSGKERTQEELYADEEEVEGARRARRDESRSRRSNPNLTKELRC